MFIGEAYPESFTFISLSLTPQSMSSVHQHWTLRLPPTFAKYGKIHIKESLSVTPTSQESKTSKSSNIVGKFGIFAQITKSTGQQERVMLGSCQGLYHLNPSSKSQGIKEVWLGMEGFSFLLDLKSNQRSDPNPKQGKAIYMATMHRLYIQSLWPIRLGQPRCITDKRSTQSEVFQGHHHHIGVRLS